MIELKRGSLLYGNKDITCCFTGHRRISVTSELTQAVADKIQEAYAQGYRFFCAGGALGFDTLAADVIISLKKTRIPDIRLILILPYPDQSKSWSEPLKRNYDIILKSADEVIYTSSFYYSGCMLTRDRALVDVSSYCISYQTEYEGGTAYTVRYAKNNGLKIVNLADQYEC